MRPNSRGFSLLESVFAVAVAAVLFLGTLSLLSYARLSNQLEQERTRAHQIVSQKIEIERFRLFTWTASQSQQTIWDNNTPGDTSDDTVGTLEILVRNAQTGALLTAAPNPAVLVEIEGTLTWHPRGPLAGRTLRETIMTLKAP